MVHFCCGGPAIVSFSRVFAHGKHHGVDYRSPFKCSQHLIIKEHNGIASWRPFKFSHTNTTGLPLNLVSGVWGESLVILQFSLLY